jgi:hypothetical protein
MAAIFCFVLLLFDGPGGPADPSHVIIKLPPLTFGKPHNGSACNAVDCSAILFDS